MIVLDTNQVQGAGDLLLHMLKAVADRSDQKLMLPQMVWDEILAHVHRDVERWNLQLDQAQRELRKLHAGWQAAQRLDADLVVRARRAQLERVFGTLDTPEDVYREALRREAWREAPARQEGKFAVGGRDTAIWLSAVAAWSAGAKVHFVADDGDFRSGGVLHERLEQDLAGTGADRERFIFHRTVPNLLEALAEPDKAGLKRSDLDAAPVRAAVSKVLSEDVLLMYELMRDTGLWEGSVAVGRTTGTHKIELRPAEGNQRMHTFRVGDQRCGSAEAVWRVCQPVTVTQGAGGTTTLVGIEFSVQTTMVMERDDHGEITRAEVVQRDRCRNVRLTEEDDPCASWSPAEALRPR